jgi:hypothetical protein
LRRDFVLHGEDVGQLAVISFGPLLRARVAVDHPEDWPMTKDASWGPSTHAHTDTRIPWYEIRDGLPQSASAWPEVSAAKDYVDTRG